MYISLTDDGISNLSKFIERLKKESKKLEDQINEQYIRSGVDGSSALDDCGLRYLRENKANCDSQLKLAKALLNREDFSTYVI